MPSPDVASYVGLDLLDVDAQTLVDTALTNAAEDFPDWTPREGNTEVVVLEQVAAIAEDVVYAINQLPNGLAEVLLRILGRDRDQGAPPYAEVRFTVTDPGGYTIPQGTTVRLPMGDSSEPVDFTTDLDLTIPAGEVAGVVVASAAEAGVLANGRPAGTALELLDAVTYVSTVELAGTVTGGRVAEDGDAFLDRTAVALGRLTNTLVRPADVETYLAERADLTRIRVLDLYNPNTPETPPGNAPGYVTAAVSAGGGGTLTATAKDLIAADLRNKVHAGLVVNVVDADVTTLDVAVTVLRFAGADAATVTANVEAAIRAHLNPDTWAWEKTVRINDLIAAVDAATGVDAVLAVTTPAGDVTLNGYAPLAKAGAVTVTVENPAA